MAQYSCMYIYVYIYNSGGVYKHQEATYVLRVLAPTEEATVAEEGRRFVVAVPLTYHHPDMANGREDDESQICERPQCQWIINVQPGR